MSRRKRISTAARYGVWDAWDGRCAWCRKPIMFADCQIDHLVPLNAVQSLGAEFLQVHFGLSDTFEFDDFPNWVPSCWTCNSEKAGRLFDGSPAYMLQLQSAGSRARLASATCDKRSSFLICRG
jgi:5-methylcytosine-specific restriction endonuclease McrA